MNNACLDIILKDIRESIADIMKNIEKYKHAASVEVTESNI